MFAATRTSVGHAAQAEQAFRSTQSSIWSMSPISSATGMNTAGGTFPRVGWFQRVRASELENFFYSIDGLKVQFELVFVERAAKIEFEVAAGLCFDLQFGLEKPPRVAALRFCLVERHVGVAQERPDFDAILGDDREI